MSCPLHWVHDLPAPELAERLERVGLAPGVVEDLVRLRTTAGAEQRIEAELGLLPELAEAGLVPAYSTDPRWCTCGADDEPEPAEPEWEPEPPDRPDPPPPPEPPSPPELADALPYDEVGWAVEVADAAEAAAAADAAELGW